MPDVIRHPEAGEPGTWIPACAGMTGSYTAALFALGEGGTHAFFRRPVEKRKHILSACAKPGPFLWSARHLGHGLLPGPAAATPLATRTVLDNGAVLLLAERPGVPMVVMNITLKTGSTADPVDKAGVANLTALLLTRGTQQLHRPGPGRSARLPGHLGVGFGRLRNNDRAGHQPDQEP